MNLELFIARRYIFSKKSSNAINIISWISVLSITIATFALVIVLSAFNGLQHLVESMYEGFEADVKVQPATGKWLEISDDQLNQISKIEGVETVSKVLEELVLVKYGENQSPCMMKGVDTSFLSISHLNENIVEGEARLSIADQPTAVIGFGLANSLSVYVDDYANALKLYIPRLTSTTIIDPNDAFYTKSISPAGIYLINPDIDNKFLIVPIGFAQELIHKNTITGIELKVADDAENSVKEKLEHLLGNQYKVESRFESNKIIYQTNKAEKVVTFVILLFILILAAFNVISTLTMILLEKIDDIKILNVIGMETTSIRKLFMYEGLMINFSGALIGIVFGVIVCLLQINLGLIRLEGGIVEFYPVKLIWTDFVLIVTAVFTIGFLASYLPAKILIREEGLRGKV